MPRKSPLLSDSLLIGIDIGTGSARAGIFTAAKNSMRDTGAMSFLKSLFFILGGLLVLSLAAQADVKLPSIFSEHMVLQKSDAVPIWGKGDPDEKVTITLNGQTASATTGADGKWETVLNLKDSPTGPFVMTIAGKNTATICDVVVGQVWLASGQSNMERTLTALAKGDDIAHSANPMLRQFRVERKGADTPQDDCNGTWTVADPKTAGDFTAVGYYFGKKLQAELQQPIGLVNVSWGGTIIEAWISQDSIAKDADLKAGETAREKAMADYPGLRDAYIKSYADWLKTSGREDKPCPDPSLYAGENVSTADWTPITLPGNVAGANLPPNGAIWVRREVDVPPGAEVQSINGSMGPMFGFESVYWNGKKITEMTYDKLQGEGMGRVFGIPQTEVHPGKSVIAIRIYAPAHSPAFLAPPTLFNAGPIPLPGTWYAKAEYALPALTPDQLATVPKSPTATPGMKASFIYNGVVHPVIPYGLAGVLWYQGESNSGYGYQYRTTLPLLINDMRTKWGVADLPFYICQLPSFQPKKPEPSESAWAELRESQSLALSLPNTSEAVLIDLGEAGDIHPRDKVPVGDRLVRIALARQYGGQLIYSGPVYKSMATEGNKIRIKFDHTDGGLVAKPLPATYQVRMVVHQTAPLVPNSPGSQLEGFAICDADQKWGWAKAKIDGGDVLVWSDQVTQPIAVRYAWADNPTCNLYNAADLPAAPFRTDDFPVSTQNNRFGLPAIQK